ncbi:MAG: adenylate/guanylate cyclase domain-containing protein [Chloroflexota bacterium]|nr:adenylate/guanylate cyclase domain-containing protein [Chloroflexota bacterium]
MPDTRYAKSGDLSIAYQVAGDGPIDLVFAAGWISNVELGWEHPRVARFYERLASFSRLILFDKRGTGLSDRVPDSHPPTIEERTDDIRAVLDAAGSDQAAIFGASEGGNMSIVFAAAYPGRTTALITYSVFAKRVWSADYPWAPTPEERRTWLDGLISGWSGDADLRVLVPSVVNDEATRTFFARQRRHSVSPSAAVALGRMNTEIDIRAVLPTVRVPTLMFHPVEDGDANIEEGRWMAARIPNARLIELPGGDHVPYFQSADAVLDATEEFLTGARPTPNADRFLATVLFTDIVNGTAKAAELGDRGWRSLLEEHHAIVRRELARFRGTEIDTAGDSFFATFDGPARAVRCGLAIRDTVRSLGLEIRAGVHTGECEVMAGKTGGIAVIIGSRVREQAAPGEVLASSTVKDLTAGSGLHFEPIGPRRLKGVPDEWQIFSAGA